jgi:hypothetical protein
MLIFFRNELLGLRKTSDFHRLYIHNNMAGGLLGIWPKGVRPNWEGSRAATVRSSVVCLRHLL